MSTRNKSNKNNDQFDFDQFLEDKANGEESTTHIEEEAPKKSNFLKNATLVLVAVVGTVLWYYDWNPKAAYAGIFGNDDFGQVTTELDFPRASTQPPQPVTPPVPPISETARLAEIEQSTEALVNSEELERLTEQSIALAMESAMQALVNLESLEGLESLESFENVEGLDDISLFAERAALEALRNIDFSEIQIETGTTNIADFDQFSKELTEQAITQFSEQDLKDLHQAGVPSSFLVQLNDVGLLDRLDAQEIIELFKKN